MQRDFLFFARLAALSLFFLFAFSISVFAQTSAFTYQGRFSDSSTNPPTTSGTYSMTFRLYDADGTDAQNPGNLIATQTATLVSVVNGIFTARIDFGANAFNTTQNRFLEIQVGSTVLAPRQQINSAPFSVRSNKSASADALSSACVACVTNAQIDSVDGAKITGTVTNATNAGNAVTATNAQNLGGVAASSFLQTSGGTVTGNLTVNGVLSGNGSGLTNLPSSPFPWQAAAADTQLPPTRRHSRTAVTSRSEQDRRLP